MKVLIVDDEALARTRLRALLGQCHSPSAQVQAEAANATQALECLRRQLFDVALVDIHMPGADGLTLAQVLPTAANAPAVVFVSAYAEHAVQAFALDAVDYLTKPVRLERLQEALQKVERFQKTKGAVPTPVSEDVLVIQEHDRIVRVPLSQVLYLKAELKYITVRSAGKCYLLEASLNELEAKYSQYFLRIHRNALISRSAVQALERGQHSEEGQGWAVRLRGIDELLWVSRRQLAGVRALLVNKASG